MAVLKVKDPVTGTWLDIMGTGVKGDPGGPVPVGGAPGEVIVKTGPADMEVGWERRPRVAFNIQIASAVSNATINTMTDTIVGDATFFPDRMYHIFASHRCIQDLGVGGTIQMQVSIGTVNLQGYDVVACTDPNSIWGAWSQGWLHDGALLGGTDPAGSVLSCRLRHQCSIASRTIYTPRLHVIEY
jgi:hypothetical protein